MDATNPSAPFKVKLAAQVVSLGPSGGRGIKFTVTTPRPAYLLLLSRDSTGQVNVLLPNANMLTIAARRSRRHRASAGGQQVVL